MKTTPTFLVIFGSVALAGSANAQLAYGTAGTVVSQNFDTLADSGGGITWANDSTLSGWYLYNKDNVARTAYDANTGTATGGSFYSYGSLNASDRALGAVGTGTAYWGSPDSGAVAGWMAVAFKNTTSGSLQQFTVAFDGEQWRAGGGTSPEAQTMVFEYGFGSSFSGVSTWTGPGGTFNWTSPEVAPAGALDGNTAGKVASRGGTISGLTWNKDDTLWLRWVERNDVGNDHGLAIDNFSFSAAVPEPHEYAMLAGLGLVGFALWRRRAAK